MSNDKYGKEALSKLGSVQESVSQKADRSEVRLVAEKITPEDFSEEALGLVTGTGEVNLDPLDNSVTPKKIYGSSPSDNLFNKETRQLGLLITSTGGSTNELADTSDYIAVTPNTTYTITDRSRVGFYRQDKSYIGRDSLDINTAAQNRIIHTFITPSDCFWVRISMQKIKVSTFQMVLGAKLTYEEFLPYKPFISSVSSFVTHARDSVIAEQVDIVRDAEGRVIQATKSYDGMILGVVAVEYEGRSVSSVVETNTELGLVKRYSFLGDTIISEFI